MSLDNVLQAINKGMRNAKIPVKFRYSDKAVEGLLHTFTGGHVTDESQAEAVIDLLENELGYTEDGAYKFNHLKLSDAEKTTMFETGFYEEGFLDSYFFIQGGQSYIIHHGFEQNEQVLYVNGKKLDGVDSTTFTEVESQNGTSIHIKHDAFSMDAEIAKNIDFTFGLPSRLQKKIYEMSHSFAWQSSDGGASGFSGLGFYDVPDGGKRPVQNVGEGVLLPAHVLTCDAPDDLPDANSRSPGNYR